MLPGLSISAFPSDSCELVRHALDVVPSASVLAFVALNATTVPICNECMRAVGCSCVSVCTELLPLMQWINDKFRR